MHASASGSYDDTANGGHRGGCCGRLTRNPWSVWEIAAMVGGFVVFWPLGLLALFMKWKNGEMWRGASETKAPWSEFKMPRFADFGSWSARGASYGYSASGNHAFDDYRRETLRRLDEERRKLDEEQREFRDFVDKLRRAKDQEEFDRFMADRRRVSPADPAN